MSLSQMTQKSFGDNNSEMCLTQKSFGDDNSEMCLTQRTLADDNSEMCLSQMTQKSFGDNSEMCLTQRTLADDNSEMCLSQMTQKSFGDDNSEMCLTQRILADDNSEMCLSQVTQKSHEDDNSEICFSQMTQKSFAVEERKMSLSQMSQNSFSDDLYDMNLTQLSQMSCADDEYGESFLQKGTCGEIAPRLPKCQSCCMALFKFYSECRFDSFRKLRYSRKGYLARAGFLDAHTDVQQDDFRLWLPSRDNVPSDLSQEMAKYVLLNIGEQFCKLVQDEKYAVSVYKSLPLKAKRVAWKKLLQNVREVCDVCFTTLFNVHWTCRRCGFAVCIDCYLILKGDENVAKAWTQCACKRIHRLDLLILTQVIPGDALDKLNILAHDTRLVPMCCGCHADLASTTDDLISKEDNVSAAIASIVETRYKDYDGYLEEDCFSLRELNKSLVLSRFRIELTSSDVLTPTQRKRCKGTLCEEAYSPEIKHFKIDEGKMGTTVNPLRSQKPCSVDLNCNSISDDSVSHLLAPTNHLNYNGLLQNKSSLHIQTSTSLLTATLYPNLPHSWLCQGRLLRLLEPHHPNNMKIFQDYWIRGHPILVSNVHNHLNTDLWKPESFMRDFGDTKNDLVNCLTGNIIPDQYMRTFWEGFLCVSKMLKDVEGNPMLLKLKDWPPEEDFAKMLPSRFEDLMRALPLGEYTRHTGELNLATRLPDSIVRPDLGPKMYIAYGSAVHPTKGTTNLHLDMSDAVNIMVYAGIPTDVDLDHYAREIYQAVDQACSFDEIMKNRYRRKTEVPGALWHIYDSRDSDKIRDLLNKVAIERGTILRPHQDPIHDQNWYLDEVLRERLYMDYGVKGYAIIQSMGDAIFIPAGAPHQVKNLANCIKVAEDFVSPENVSHCLRITQEFRKLTHFHTNHEDKLQIKNIIYHAVKDCLSVLSQEENYT